MESKGLNQRRTSIVVWAAFISLIGVFWMIITGGSYEVLSFIITIFTLLKSWIFSIILGLSFGVFTWMMTYIDSRCPGVNPPTPMSSWKLRKSSGHTFHVGYAFAVLNGLMLFLTSVYYQGSLF